MTPVHWKITVLTITPIERSVTGSGRDTQHSLQYSCRPSHLPREAVALAVVEPEVRHLAVFDVHARRSHRVLGIPAAGLAAVGDDLRDGADIRPPIVFVFVDGVVGGVPGEHLRKEDAGLNRPNGL